MSEVGKDTYRAPECIVPRRSKAMVSRSDLAFQVFQRGAVPASSESSEVIVPTNAGPEDVIMHRESGGLGGLYQAW